MTVYLTAAQNSEVAGARQSPRPEFFNANTGQETEITADFEAFLILQGQSNNNLAASWLQIAAQLTNVDYDRDALMALMLNNDAADAKQAQFEIKPLIDAFGSFQSTYSLIGFEAVPEVGLLNNDLQLPMNEMMTMMSRLNHRQTFASFTLDVMLDSGVTEGQQTEINSWYAPLSAY